jgi:hypothetical protein
MPERRVCRILRISGGPLNGTHNYRNQSEGRLGRATGGARRGDGFPADGKECQGQTDRVLGSALAGRTALLQHHLFALRRQPQKIGKRYHRRRTAKGAGRPLRLRVEADRKLMDAAARPVHQDTIGESMKKSMTTKKSGQLKLLKLPDALKELLMVTKFLSVFQVYDDEEEAIASFI